MAIEDFTTYTEVDTLGKLTEATRRVTFTTLRDTDDDTYVYVDKGAAYFAADFTCDFTVKITASAKNQASAMTWGIANALGDFQALDDASEDGLFLHQEHPNAPDRHQIELFELDGGQVYGSGNFTLTVDTIYYFRVYRDESVGTYGTLYCKIYSDAGRTTSPGTLSVALHTSKKDFQYLYAVQSYDGTSVAAMSGYIEDLEVFLNLTGVLELANTYLTDFTDTTVTGNAYIVNTGISSVTEHGHCWATSRDPTTADSKTTNGAGVLGLFSSSITGLITGQQYYTRAYATNTEGTAYGPNIRFIAGRSASLLLPFEIKVVQTRLHYVDFDGKERYLEGTLV